MIQDIARPADFPKDRALLDFRGQDPMQAQALYPNATIFVFRRRVGGVIIMIDNRPRTRTRPPLMPVRIFRVRVLPVFDHRKAQDEKPTPRPRRQRSAPQRPAQPQEQTLETQDATPIRHTYDSPEGLSIIARIDEISKAAADRREACRDPFLRNIKPAAFDWMTDEERDQIHALQLQLRQTTPDEARARVEARRQARKETETPAAPKLSDIIAQLDFFTPGE